MKKPLAAVAALVVSAGLSIASFPSSTSAAPDRQAAPQATTQVRHFVLTQIRSHRTGRFTFAGTDRIRDRATKKVVGSDRYTGRINPKTHVARLRVRIILKRGTMQAVVTQRERSNRFHGPVVSGSGAYKGARGSITGHNVGHTNRRVVTMRYTLPAGPGSGPGGGPGGGPGSGVPSPHLTRYPYLTDVVNAGGSTVNATVNFATDQTVTAAFATMGVGSCNSTRKTGSKTTITVGTTGEYQWKVKFTGLTPDTQYCYRIMSGSPTTSGTDLLGTEPTPVFSTPPVAGSNTPFTFAVFGDWGATNANGTNPDQANVDAQIASSGALFALGTGDTAYPGGSQTNYGDLNQTGPDTSTVFGPNFFTRIGAGIPMYNALGNHGLSATFLNVWPQPTAPTLSVGRYQMDSYASVNGSRVANYPSVWYAFDVGRARVYILDATWANSNQGTGNLYTDDNAAHWQTTSPEYQWLQSDLAAHPGGLKFAVMHLPMYADNASEGTDPQMHGPGSVGDLLTQNGVQMVFNGHMHGYERNAPTNGESFVSYVTGGGGETLEPVGNNSGGCGTYDKYAVGWSPTKSAGSACGAATPPTSAAQVYHFLLVSVGPSSVTVTPTDSTGRTFDVQTYNF